MATGPDFILDALLREGLDHLFMVPGGLVDPFLPALARHPVRLSPRTRAVPLIWRTVTRAPAGASAPRSEWRPWPLQYGDRGRGSEDGLLPGAPKLDSLCRTGSVLANAVVLVRAEQARRQAAGPFSLER
jgi:hypothetical protein